MLPNTNPYDFPETPTRHNPQPFPPLQQVTRSMITTEEAAFYLNRMPQTLRIWACYENGPLLPTRIHGRLYWSVSEIMTLLSGK